MSKTPDETPAPVSPPVETPDGGDASAQGTPVEPGAPSLGELVEVGGRYGIVMADDPCEVLWLGTPSRCDLPLRRVG